MEVFKFDGVTDNDVILKNQRRWTSKIRLESPY